MLLKRENNIEELIQYRTIIYQIFRQIIQFQKKIDRTCKDIKEPQAHPGNSPNFHEHGQHQSQFEGGEIITSIIIFHPFIKASIPFRRRRNQTARKQRNHKLVNRTETLKIR